MTTIANVKVGKPDTSPSLPAHTPGIKQGNGSGHLEKEAGFYTDGQLTKATPRRSTGVGAEHREPIDPRMPCLSPP
jgi:hypothetical protein